MAPAAEGTVHQGAGWGARRTGPFNCKCTGVSEKGGKPGGQRSFPGEGTVLLRGGDGGKTGQRRRPTCRDRRLSLEPMAVVVDLRASCIRDVETRQEQELTSNIKGVLGTVLST